MWLKQFLVEAKRVIKDTGAIVLCCDQKTNYRIRLLLDEVFGENNFVNEIVWLYGAGGYKRTIPFATKHDTIYIYSKTENYFYKKLIDPETKTIYKDWWRIKSIADKSGYLKIDDEWKILTPYQKPKKLFERFILALTKENDVVLDPFMGSGTTAAACIQTNRKFIGYEIDKEYCKIANKRLSQEVLKCI